MGLNLIITESSVFFLQILREINHSYHTDENEIKWKWMISGSGSKKKNSCNHFWYNEFSNNNVTEETESNTLNDENFNG